MKYFLFISLFASISTFAQSYNPGLPVPGLPNSLGPKTMAKSTSVTLASDQTPITITGTISVTNPSVGTNFVAAPTSSTLVGTIDGSGKLQPLLGGTSGLAITGTVTSNPNTTGSLSSGSVSVTTTASSPAKTEGFLIEALSSNTDNIRFAVGSVATSTNGVRLEPGRSEFLPLGANVSICPESGTQSYVIQWVTQ